MTEKIDWYREVLEIEPNSKVFFPLAKLLVKENNSREAIGVLEHGLERHPEFLEARLLLIELMHKNGEKEACERQIAKLSSMFASYAGFWEAWAACLSSQPGDADTASIIRFLAAHFISGPLQLHDVLDRGLEVILHEKAGSAETVAKASTAIPLVANHAAAEDSTHDGDIEAHSAMSENPEKTSNLPVVENPQHEDAGNIDIANTDESNAENAESATVVENELDSPADNFLTEEKEQDASNPEVETLTAGQTMMSGVEASGLQTDELPAQEQEDPSAFEEIPEQEEIPVEKNNTAQIASELAKIASSIPQNEEQQEKENNDAVENSVDEPFSLRTRSMADVLAEQGDYKGALDIYLELAASGPDAKEAEVINRRIEELQSRSGKDNSIQVSQDEAPASKSKEKLIGMLEALAQRVEARVQN